MNSEDKTARGLILHVDNDSPQISPLHVPTSPAQFLTTSPTGAYTCIRFSRSDASALGIDFHLQRLTNSHELLTNKPCLITSAHVTNAVEDLARHVPHDALNRALITLLIPTEGAVPRLYGHVVYPLQVDTLVAPHVLVSEL